MGGFELDMNSEDMDELETSVRALEYGNVEDPLCDVKISHQEL